jgi:hypothetical protein
MLYTADSTGYYYLPLTYDTASGDWVVSHNFSEGDRPGSWYIDIEMFDIAGNFDWVTLENPLSLTNPFSDFTASTIGEPVFSTTSASPGESVKVSVPVSDEQSGVSSVYAEFSHIDNPDDSYLQHLTLDQASGEWVGDLNIESNFQSGIWNVVIHSTDNARNSGFKEIFGAFDVSNNNGDFDAPVISNVVVTPQGDVQVGETVTVTAKVSDNVGVDSVRATLYSQEGSQFIDMNYDEANEQWIGNLLVQESTAPGFYSVSIAAYDTSFNINFVDAEGGFTVNNPEGDYTGPVVSDVVFDKTEVNAGEQITIIATVEDAESGIASVSAHYYGNETIDLAYNSDQDKWLGTITVPMNIPDGEEVNINYIDAVDSKGNQTVRFYDGISFLVHNPDGDYTAPVVESFELTPSTVKPGEKIHFEAKLVDDKSAIKYATIHLYNDSDPNITSIELTYNEANDVWNEDYVVPTNAVLGSYSVSFEVEDNAQNEANYLHNQKLLVVSEDTDITAPVTPTVDIVTDKTTEVTGITEANAEVTVKVGDIVIGSGKSDAEGKFSITIPVQPAGTTISVTARDEAGNESTSQIVTGIHYDAISIQINGAEFTQGGYYGNKTTYVNWNALDVLGIPYTDKGNGVFEIEGNSVQAVNINDDWYIHWKSLTPGKIIYKQVENGFNFIYTKSLNIQINGLEFTHGGYYLNKTTYLNWNVLKTLKIPYTYQGNGVFLIENRTVQAEAINGAWYIHWKEIAPEKMVFNAISGGFNFGYTKPITIKINGNDFAHGGYYFNRTTFVNWNALKALKIPYTYQGNGVFQIDGRTVKAVAVNGDWYIQWKLLAPDRIIYKEVDGGFNFIYTQPISIQLNGGDFHQGGYYLNKTTYVNWNALNTFNIPYTHKGNGVFVIGDRNVSAESINGDWYIHWKELAPGKVTYTTINGGYNFTYTP